MFHFDGSFWRSDLLEAKDVGHAFSTRLGGTSVLPHTSSMNVGFGRGDSDDVVRENIRILCGAADISCDGLVGSAQFHTTHIRYVTEENAGEGITAYNPSPSDGFVTDRPGVSVIVRTADCTPILLAGRKADGSPVVGAAHAGWKGTVNLIAENLVASAVGHGAEKDSLRAAIGPCIGKCCFEVKEDFIEVVRAARGRTFAEKYIEARGGRYFADLPSMNLNVLISAGVGAERVDVCGACTACDPHLYHSHRATGGVRGTMGAVIGIRRSPSDL